MNHNQIAAVITRHAQSHGVNPKKLLGAQLPQKGMKIYVRTRRAAMAELNELGMPICKLAKLFRISWPTASHHIKKHNTENHATERQDETKEGN